MHGGARLWCWRAVKKNIIFVIGIDSEVHPEDLTGLTEGSNPDYFIQLLQLCGFSQRETTTSEE